MMDYFENILQRLARLDIAEKRKKIITGLAVCGIAGSILLVFSPLGALLIEIAERIKPIKSTTWRSFFGSTGIFAMLFCGFVLYGLYSVRVCSPADPSLSGKAGGKTSGKTACRCFVALIAAILAVTTYINFVYGRQWIDSDMASEMILGNLLAKENKLVTSSWVYSTELRLVYQQLFYMPLFKLFDSWHLVRTIAILLNNIVLLASYFFMMRQFDVSRKTVLLTSLFLILPVAGTYWKIVLFGGYYVFFIAMFFCCIGLSAILLNFDGSITVKKRNAAFVFFALLSITLGLGGVRGLMDIQVPMFITAVCAYFLGRNSPFNSKPLFLTGAGLVLCAAGYAVNFLLHRFFHFLSHHGADTIDLSGIFFQKLGDLLYNFILFLGYTPNAKFMAPPGVLNFAVVIIVFLIFYEAVRLIKNRHGGDMSAVNVFFMMFYIVSTAYHVTLFLILNEDGLTWHLIPTQVLYIPALAIIFEFVKKSMTQRKAATFISVIAFVILCNGMIRLHSLPEADSTRHRQNSISYLEENNLRFGFASFDNANVITELTNGRVEMFSLAPDDYHRLNVWLYPIAYKNPDYYKGETFLLLTRNERLNDETLASRAPDYEDDNFVIWRYPSASRVFEEVITEE
jgi:hypothetical protein